MPPDKSEKIKLFVVIGLSIILVTMAYFRFWHKKSGTAPDRLAAAASQPAPVVTDTTSNRQSDEGKDDRPTAVSWPSVERDIFRPVTIPSAVVSRTSNNKPEKLKPTPVPNFKLGGTIVGGGESMAIINGRFLRTGDSIAAFKVVRIEKNKVQLASGKKKIELKMISNE